MIEKKDAPASGSMGVRKIEPAGSIIEAAGGDGWLES
jgi:hypothetical protein